MALRNAVDVGHSFLSILKREQLNTLYLYTESAEENFRGLLQKVIESLNHGSFKLGEYEELSPSKDVLSLLKRMDRQINEAN